MTPEDIKAIRAARGMTQQDLSKAIGITRGHVTKLEAGYPAKGPTKVALRAIALLGHPDTWPDSITPIHRADQWTPDQLAEIAARGPAAPHLIFNRIPPMITEP